MYDKINILKGDIDEIIYHLNMNGYKFYVARPNILFTFVEETDYVETILADHKVKYVKNDGENY